MEKTLETKKEVLPEQKQLEALHRKIIGQLNAEYEYADRIQKPKLEEWRERLKVYNNQKRKKTKVGDPLLFTVFQTIFASLYGDKLKVSFLPREPGDKEVAENLNITADYDYTLMEKDILDYEWDWDTMFFGRGFMLNMEFDSKRQVPAPEVISPLSLLRDPRAISVNGNSKGFGGARFLGREVAMTKYQLEKNSAYFNLERLSLSNDRESLLKKEERARDYAQGLQTTWKEESKLEGNAYYNILQWFTFFNGQRYLIELANNRSLVIRFQKLKNQNEWPIQDRTLFPIAHDWDGVSIPDLVEDKQRARALLLNLGLEAAKANANPMYLFDINRIKRRDALDFEFNKFVPVDGDTTTAVSPMRKDLIKQEVQWIMGLLDESAQRALATPELQQGSPSTKQRTLGELELVSSKVDTRYSLAAKIFGWSERRFWQQWYFLYKTYFKEGISEKVARLTGIWGADFRTLTRENLIGRQDPDIKIESKIVSDQERMIKRQLFVAYLGMASQDPDFNHRASLKELGELSGLSSAKIKQLFPPTIDEIQAEAENKELEKGNIPQVKITDDHQTHLIIHGKLNEGKALEAHIKTHYEAMRIKKLNIKTFQEMGLEKGQIQPIQANIAPKSKRSPTIIPQTYQKQ